MHPGNCLRKMMLQTLLPTRNSCVIKYVLNTKNLVLKIEPKGNSDKTWDIVCFSNSNYAGGMVSRQSISGFILDVLGVLVSWQWKSWKSVSLSSSDVEYIALSEAVKEVMFVVQLLGSMKIAVKYPVTVRVDNICTIFMTSTTTTNVIQNTLTFGISMWMSLWKMELLR